MKTIKKEIIEAYMYLFAVDFEKSKDECMKYYFGSFESDEDFAMEYYRGYHIAFSNLPHCVIIDWTSTASSIIDHYEVYSHNGHYFIKI